MVMRREPFHPRRAAGVAAALAAFLMLGACSSGADPADVTASTTPFTASEDVTTATSNPSPNTSPSPGAVVGGDGRFNVVVPGGWNLSRQPKTVAYLSSATVSHDVAATIAVTRSSISPAPALDDTLRLATMQARQDGQSVAAAPDRVVGGEKAVSFTATVAEKNVDIKRTYVIVAHDKVLYTIALTTAAEDAARDEATLTSLLSSWTWTRAGEKGSTASGTTPAAVPTTTAASPKPSSSASSQSPSSAPSASSSSSGARSAAPSSARSRAGGPSSSTAAPTPSTAH